MGTRTGLRRLLAALVVIVSLLATAGCTQGATSKPASPSAGAPGGTAGSGLASIRVRTAGHGKARIEPADLTAAQAKPLAVWRNRKVRVGDPVEITLPHALPRRGIVLERTYDAPLPAGAAATFGYFDPALGAWHAVASRLSADRMTLTARVHHLSVWTDFVDNSLACLGDVGSCADYWIGKVFDTRVDPPTCTGGPPAWVKSTVFIQPDRTNPLMFCTGHDPKRPDLLVVKARVNRGYGYSAQIAGPTQWQYNSTFANQPNADDVLSAAGHPGDASFDLLQAMFTHGLLVGPGQELSFGLNEEDSWSADDPLLTMSTPDPAEFLTWVLAQLVVTNEADLKSQGLLGAAFGVSGCAADLRQAHDAGSAVAASLSCLTAIDEDLARHLATALDKRGVKDAGKVAGHIVGKLSVLLALIGPVFGAMTYFADAHLGDGARTVSMLASVPPRVTRKTLLTAQVPADCGLPPQRLVNGRTTKGGPGDGVIGTVPPYLDMAGLGYRQALTTYWCNAGGVSWPEQLLLVGSSGNLLASFDLGDLGHHEHAVVDNVSVAGNIAQVRWRAYEGAGFYIADHTSRVSYQGGKLVVSDAVTGYGDAGGFAEAVVQAAAANDRSLLAPGVSVPESYWRLLVKTTAGRRDATVLCGWPSDNPGSCTLSFEPDFQEVAHFLVSRQRGVWRVDYASTSVD